MLLIIEKLAIKLPEVKVIVGFMAVNIDTFISNKCTFFLEVAQAIYLIKYNTTN